MMTIKNKSEMTEARPRLACYWLRPGGLKTWAIDEGWERVFSREHSLSVYNLFATVGQYIVLPTPQLDLGTSLHVLFC